MCTRVKNDRSKITTSMGNRWSGMCINIFAYYNKLNYRQFLRLMSKSRGCGALPTAKCLWKTWRYMKKRVWTTWKTQCSNSKTNVEIELAVLGFHTMMDTMTLVLQWGAVIKSHDPNRFKQVAIFVEKQDFRNSHNSIGNDPNLLPRVRLESVKHGLSICVAFLEIPKITSF